MSLGKGASGLGLTPRTAFDLGVDVAHDLLKDDVDLGASVVSGTRGGTQVLSTAFAHHDLGDLDGLDRAGIGAPGVRVHRTLALGAGAGARGLVVGGLRGRLARVRAVLRRVLLHEHRYQQLEQRQQSLAQGAGLRRHLVLARQPYEAPLQRIELLAQRLFVERRHVRRSTTPAPGPRLPSSPPAPPPVRPAEAPDSAGPSSPPCA